MVPPLMAPQLDENIPKKVVGKPLKCNLLEDLPKVNDSRLKKRFDSLNLKGIRVMGRTAATIS